MKKQIFTLSLLFSLLELQAKDSSTFTMGASVNQYTQFYKYRTYCPTIGLKHGRNHFSLGLAIVSFPTMSPEITFGAALGFSRTLNVKSSIFDPYLHLHILGYNELSNSLTFASPSLQTYIGYGIQLNITKQHHLASDFNIGHGWLEGDKRGHGYHSMFNLKYIFYVPRN